MSLEFEEPKFDLDKQNYKPEQKTGPIVKFLTKIGIVKNVKQANILIIIISLFCLTTSGIIIKIFILR